MPSAPILLIDGSSYLFRAFHAAPPHLSTADGVPTGTIRLFINMLQKLLKDYPGSPVVMVFDPPGGNFRNEIYPEYKANRGKMDDDLRVQIAPIHEFCDAMGMPPVVIPNTEADDVLGTLAVRAADLNHDVIICTGDKDLAQLVNERISLLDGMKNTMTGPDEVVEKHGVPPERIAEMLALAGDRSDNISGVTDVGPKTAVDWLNKYGSLEALIASADELGGKRGEHFRKAIGDELDLYMQLVTIRTDLDVDLNIASLSMPQPDIPRLEQLHTRFGLGKLRSAAKPAEKTTETNQPDTDTPMALVTAIKKNYQLVTERAHLDKWIQQLSKAEWFAFDTETDNLDYSRARLVGLSFALPNGRAAYVPLAHRYVGAPEQLDIEEVLHALRPLLEDEHPRVVGQNLKYDRHVLSHYGIELRAIRSDTMLESWVLDSVATRHNLDALARHYLQLETTSYEEVAGKGTKQISFDQVEVQTACNYAAEDAEVAAKLHQTLDTKLKEQPGLQRLLRELELPFIPVLQRIEQNGVLINEKTLKAQSDVYGERLQDLQQQVWKLAGMEFNLSSPAQLGEVLYEKLGLKAGRRTSGGKSSTAEDVLQNLAREHEVPRLLLQHRMLFKLKSTYTDKLPEMINPQSGRLHTSYHQAGTITGRLSSSNPNLQNIPIRTEEGRQIRSAFIAAPGHKLLAADYSQIELRIMAHLSEDQQLLTAFAEGQDIHSATASEVFGVSLDQVSNLQRRHAKAINFGLIYGMSAHGLARQLDIKRDQAQDYMDTYFLRYPGVQKFMQFTREHAAQTECVATLFNRQLRLPGIRSKNYNQRQAAERTAINAPMQGSAADIIKKATLDLDGWLSERQELARIVLQVHDELVLEVREDALEEISDAVRKIMCNAYTLRAPLEVDIGVGDDWAQAH